MSGRERKRIERLERRADWLEARCAIAASQGRDLGFDEAELSALRWAISTLRACLGAATEAA